MALSIFGKPPLKENEVVGVQSTATRLIILPDGPNTERRCVAVQATRKGIEYRIGGNRVWVHEDGAPAEASSGTAKQSLLVSDPLIENPAEGALQVTRDPKTDALSITLYRRPT